MNGENSFYYPRTTEVITNALLTMFSKVIIYKFSSDGNKTKKINVPVTFGPQQKQSRGRTAEERRKYYPKVPRIQIVPTGMNVDAERKISVNNIREFIETGVNKEFRNEKDEIITSIEDTFMDYPPVPYNYNFTVHVICNTVTEQSQILENILPYFANVNSTLRIKEFIFLNLERDLPIEMGGINIDFPDSLSRDDRLELKSSFDLTVKGYMYKPVQGLNKINKISNNYNGGENNEMQDIHNHFILRSEYLDGEVIIPVDFKALLYDNNYYYLIISGNKIEINALTKSKYEIDDEFMNTNKTCDDYKEKFYLLFNTNESKFYILNNGTIEDINIEYTIKSG